MAAKYLLLVSAAFFARKSLCSSECSQTSIGLCVLRVNLIGNPPKSTSDIDAMCRQMAPAKACLVNLNCRQGSSDHLLYLKALGLASSGEDMCSDSNAKKVYLDNVQCIVDTYLPSEKICRKEQQASNCGVYNTWCTCEYNYTKTQCNEETARVVANFKIGVEQPILQNMGNCTIDKAKCMPQSTLTPSPVTVSTLPRSDGGPRVLSVSVLTAMLSALTASAWLTFIRCQ